jgi:hypothetical protein
MTYNTSREDIIIPEYGRNIQLLVEHAKKVEDREERQVFVETIVELIQQLYPQSRNIDDYVAKLWSHLFRIADYKLDVTPPCEILSKEDVYKRPDALPYPGNKIKYRHYGKNIQEMIDKAIKMEDDDIKEDYVQVIGSYMKMSYNAWNQDNVSDEMIRKNLIEISDGELELAENTNIDTLLGTETPLKEQNTRTPIRAKQTSTKPNSRPSRSNTPARPKRTAPPPKRRKK